MTHTDAQRRLGAVLAAARRAAPPSELTQRLFVLTKMGAGRMLFARAGGRPVLLSVVRPTTSNGEYATFRAALKSTRWLCSSVNWSAELKAADFDLRIGF